MCHVGNEVNGERCFHVCERICVRERNTLTSLSMGSDMELRLTAPS